MADNLQSRHAMSHFHVEARQGFRPAIAAPSAPVGLSETGTAPEMLFDALDGRELIVLGRRWKVEVFSVCAMGGCRYVQLAMKGQQEYMLTLRVATSAEPRLLIPRLLTWLAHPTSSGEILEVG